MRLGVNLPAFATDGYRIPANRLQRYATRVESLGFDGLWHSDHLRNPPTYSTSFLDPLTTLASLATATETIPLGTALVILPLRDPLWVAKRAATLQHLSEGRLSLGVGLGYVDSEFEAVGIRKRERSPRFTEGVDLLSRLFAREEVTFDGEFYDVTEFRLEPPTRRPPRMLVGGGNVDPEEDVPEPLKERILMADGWISPPRSPAALHAIWSDIADYLDENGQDSAAVDRLHLQQVHIVPDASTEQALTEQLSLFEEFRTIQRFADDRAGAREWLRENCLVGSTDDILEHLDALAEQGADEVILQPITRELHELDRQLNHWEEHLLSAFD